MNTDAGASVNIVYAATGERYFKEALISASSARVWHPDAKIVVYSDAEYESPDWLEVRKLPDAQKQMGDKIRAILDVEFDKFVYLDSDTYVIASLSDAYSLLEKFEFLACTCEVRVTPRMTRYMDADFDYPSVPRAFPEFNSGVMFFRASDSTSKMLQAWKEKLDLEELASGPGLPDQPSLRHALFGSDLRIHTLPSEYNMRLPYFGYYEQDIKILHGRRSKEGFEKLRSKVTGIVGPRVYMPKVGVIRQDSWPFRLGIEIRSLARNLFKKR